MRNISFFMKNIIIDRIYWNVKNRTRGDTDRLIGSREKYFEL